MTLFDFDGTLIDTNGVWEEIDVAFLHRHGLTPTAEYTEIVGRSIFPMAAQFTKDYYNLSLSPREIMDEWLALAWEAYANTAPLKEGALDFLHRCRDAGQSMALVTACVPKLCRVALGRHGLEDLFTGLVFVEDMGIEKRDPLAFLRAAELLGADPADCTMYEDSPTACAAARAAGMTVVGVHDPFYAHRQAEMENVCHRYIKSFLELL